VVAEAAVKPGELVLDIGAGEGALTGPLVEAGARVIAVELNPRRAQILRDRFPGTTVLELDAAELRLPARPFRVVANPPYGITSFLLRQLLTTRSGLTGAHLVLQRAVVRKYTVDPHRRFHLDRRFHLERGLQLPRNAFSPPPKVDSAVLVVRRKSR
jgi:23S rRNA (adenine-N6)-dimethyltransferase